ncbi:hypothetical protein L3V79_07550 [Thiotrichales bacterium 19S9-12]|nr:hypothetical protein [Thiotrichales bacterium 19S9-11]MCF6812207.1 hypothetical protein [Thiotrichales bacterium 19S9-12]
MSNNPLYNKQLEALRIEYLGIKMIYNTLMPKDEYTIINNYFNYMHIEVIKLVIGRIFILISDDQYRDYNTISYKILTNSLIKDQNIQNDKNKLEEILKKINAIDKKFKTFRDKSFAHIELDRNSDNIRKIDSYNICSNEVTSLLLLAEEIYNDLFLILSNASSDHMDDSINTFSQVIWNAFEQANLVKKSTK